MTDEVASAKDILKQAMELEEEGLQFYRKAARATRDKQAQEIFNTLAGDEQKHYDLIEKQFQALTV